MVCAPPVTEPPDAICCCTAWVSCGVVVVAVQPAWPLAMEAASALDRNAANVGRDVDRHLRRDGDVIAVDLKRYRQVVEHVLEVHVHERRNAGSAAARAATGRRSAGRRRRRIEAVAGAGGFVVLHADRPMPSAATAAAILSDWLFIFFSLMLDLLSGRTGLRVGLGLRRSGCAGRGPHRRRSRRCRPRRRRSCSVVPVVVWAPPPTLPFAASCSWMYCLSSGEMLLAVQLSLFPPPAPKESTLIDTPQTLAAMLIGIWALIGMFALSTLRSSARLLSTFDRFTLTSDGTLPTAEPTAEPALFTPSAAAETVLHAESETSAMSAVVPRILRIITGSLCVTGKRARGAMVSVVGHPVGRLFIAWRLVPVVLPLLMMTAEHGFRFRHQALGLGDAFAQAILASFDLCRLLLSPRGALLGI